MSETINVSIGGEQVSVIIEGGSIGIGASVLLADVTVAVGEANSAASAAEEYAILAAGSAQSAAQSVALVPSLISGKADRSANLSDLSNTTTARQNLYAADLDGFDLDTSQSRNFRFSLGIKTDTPDDYSGDVQDAIDAAGPSGTIYLPTGDYPVSSFDNGGGVNLTGPGRIMLAVPGGASQQVNTYTDLGKYLIGAQYLNRWIARIDPTTGGGITQPLSLTVHGDSTVARGSTNITASISGTTMTVTASNGATLVPGTFLGGVAANTRITAYGSGTGGDGTYTVNISQTVGSGTIAASNGGGFAGTDGEIQNLFPALVRAMGLQKPVRMTDYGLGGSTWADIDVVSHIADDSSSDGAIIATGLNDEGLSPDIDTALGILATNMENKLSGIRADPYGAYSQYGILVVGPSPFYYPAGFKTTEWLERSRNIILEKCRKYKAAFFDRYAMFQDMRDSGGFATDAIQVHPLRHFQFQVWAKIVAEIFPRSLIGRMHDASIAPQAVLNGWAALSDPPFKTGVRLFEDNTAQFYVAISGGTTTAGTVYANLPTWARPPFTVPFVLCTSTSGTVASRLDPNGVADFATTADATFTYGMTPRYPVQPLT